VKKLLRNDFFFREITDPYVQENFFRLRKYLEDIDTGVTGSVGPQGPQGPVGPAGPSSTTSLRVTSTFTTDVGTNVKDLVKVSGVSSVTKITDNSTASIPNGIFGLGYQKPSPTQIEVIFLGILGGFSGFTTGSPLFISTLGTLTHLVPASGMVQQVGFAISTTEIFINLMQPMRRA
jgi:hypothetical protein